MIFKRGTTVLDDGTNLEFASSHKIWKQFVLSSIVSLKFLVGPQTFMGLRINNTLSCVYRALYELVTFLALVAINQLVNCWMIHFSVCIEHGLLQVAERALFLWNNDHIVNLIAHNRQVILPIIFPALDRNVQSHWNPAVVNLTHNIRKMFLEMDEKLFISCHNHFKEEEAILTSAAEKRKEAWKQLEHAASLRPVTGNTAVLVSWLVLHTAHCQFSFHLPHVMVENCKRCGIAGNWDCHFVFESYVLWCFWLPDEAVRGFSLGVWYMMRGPCSELTHFLCNFISRSFCVCRRTSTKSRTRALLY